MKNTDDQNHEMVPMISTAKASQKNNIAVVLSMYMSAVYDKVRLCVYGFAI